MRIRADSIFTSHAGFRDALVVSFGRLHLRTEERRVWRALPFMESEMRSGFSNVTRSGERERAFASGLTSQNGQYSEGRMDLTSINRSHIYTRDEGGEGCGNPTEFVGVGLVAFIDLLGFSADVESSWSEGSDGPLSRLMRIKEAANRIPKQGILVAFPGGTPPFDPKVHGARVHTISDSIVVCSALPPSGGLNDLTIAMIAVLHGVQVAWITAIREGYTIRGAMELGHIYWSKEETVGPALVRAYHLENKLAKTSRVILGPWFLKHLLDRINDDWSAWPSSEWLSVSYDDLIELSPHELKSDRATLGGLAALQQKAGNCANKYDHILKILKDGFQKASLAEIKLGMERIRARVPTPLGGRTRTRR